MAHAKQCPPTEMERAMEKMIVIFQTHAGKEGSQCTLNVKEFETFMNTELGAFTKNQKDPEILKKIMKSVDGGMDGKPDGQIDFQEFLNLLGGIMTAFNEATLKGPAQKKAPASATKPTETECAMQSIVTTFQHYAGKKGAADVMDYTEFEGFVKTELKSFAENQKDPNVVRRLLESVDGSVDGKKDKCVNFQEFMNLIGGIMIACEAQLAARLKKV